jgi:hypothetical protein
MILDGEIIAYLAPADKPALLQIYLVFFSYLDTADKLWGMQRG